jgi:hypothetical protein
MKQPALLALLACGCWSAERVAGPAPVPPKPADRPVASCAVEPPVRVRQELQLRHWLGRVGDRTWIVVRRKLATLIAGLGPGGALVELPIDGEPYATSADGTAVWIARHVRAAAATVELLRIELGGPRPAIVQRATLALAPLHGVSAIAVSASRALVGDIGAGIRLQLFDRARGAALGATAAIASTELRSPELHCAGEQCFALGVEGDGPGRRIFVERFAPDGAHAHEQLAGDHIAEYHLAEAGGRRFALWTSFGDRGVFARELDAGGRPVGPRTRIHAGDSTDFEVVPDPERLRIAVKTAAGWSLGALDPRALRPMVASPTTLPKEAYFLAGAAMPDGTLLAGFSSSVEYQGGFHMWSGRAWATFARAGEAAEPAPLLASDAGDGRGGIAAFPLVAPGHAAVLVVPQGPESGQGGELILLRRPCAPPGSPVPPAS